MNNFQEQFKRSIDKGFIDISINSIDEYLPVLVVNDKSSGKKVLSTLQKELHNCEEFWFSVAFLTKSGITTLLNTFQALSEKGIKGKVLVSQYLNFTQPEALKSLLYFDNIESKIITNENFHSKGYLFKKENHYNLIIGSSNLTANALSTNKEMNLKVSGTPNSYVIKNALEEFQSEFNKAIALDQTFIDEYNVIYTKNHQLKVSYDQQKGNNQEISPNQMQEEALRNLKELRTEGKNKALLISATGTGKTYLSAFDMKNVNPKKALFVVHRYNIAQAALQSFKLIFGSSRSMGMFSGAKKEIQADFIFSTVQTISKQRNMNHFKPDHFDYIVIDETHRAGASSYNNILEYFKPKFLLGMTATPERTDGEDIFKLFDHNIAYEIRLQHAMKEEMLCPFHYFGITDVYVEEKEISEELNFNNLTSDERVDKIIEKAQYYGCDDGIVRGLIFCSRVQECFLLSEKFNERGYHTVALSGSSSDAERENAIMRLESEDPDKKIDYIFTVDIFNEGIDIPRVNQVIMLRPTQSAIIFVQQLGRGLRKLKGKEYLTVIDFIANYKNNYLVPIALFGDSSYNKDRLRKLMTEGNNVIPGSSTVNFDRISKERIFESIDAANMQLKKDLRNDYNLLKYKLGRIPMMMDFIEHGSRDPKLYVNYSRSYFNFISALEESLKESLNSSESKLLEYFSKEINNGVRLEESKLLHLLLTEGIVDILSFRKFIFDDYGYLISDETLHSCVRNLNLKFATESSNKQLIPIGDINNYKIVEQDSTHITIGETLENALENLNFREFLLDNTNYSIYSFDKKFLKTSYNNGFLLYEKYSRKDAFRVLNWKENPLAQNVGGYMVSPDKSNCPIYVNYHKEEHISSTTKYDDSFINQQEFCYMSKNKRTIKSPDVRSIKGEYSDIRLPLFVKKSNDEGTEFYYMGDLSPIANSFEQTAISDDKGKQVPIVRMKFKMSHRVEDSIYEYITDIK